MKRKTVGIVASLIALLLSVIALTHASEWRNDHIITKVKVPAGTGAGGANGESAEPGIAERSVSFKEGQRVWITVVGDHAPVVRLRIAITDAKGDVVHATDDGGTGAMQDWTALSFVPPRTTSYLLRIESFGAEYNDCRVIIRQ